MRVLGNNRGPVPWTGPAHRRGTSQSDKRFAVPGRRGVEASDLLGNLPVLRWYHWQP